MLLFGAALSYLIILLLIVYAVGHLCFACTQPGVTFDNKSFFYKLITGSILLIIGYAAWQTQGKSILLGIIPLLLMLAWQAKPTVKQFRSNLRKIDWKMLGWLAGISVAVLVVRYHQMVPYSIHTDYSFYAEVGNYIRKTGIESSYFDWINADMQAPTLYHYGEIWMAALVGQLFGITVLNALILVVYPLQTVLFFTGMLVFLKQQLNIPVFKAALFSLLLFCLAVFPLIISTHFAIAGYGMCGLDSLYIQKILPLCIALTCCLLSGSGRQGIIFICIAALVYSTAAPGIIAGAGIYILIRLVRRNYTADTWISLGAISFTLLYGLLFYILTNVTNPYQTETVSIFHVWKDNFKDMAGIHLFITQQLTNILINIAPYLLLLCLLAKEQRKAFWDGLKQQSVAGCLFLGGLSISALFLSLIDSIQLLTAISLPLQLILFVWTLSFVIQHTKGWKWLFPVILIAANLYLNTGSSRREMDTRFNTQFQHVVKQEGNFAFVQSGRSLIGATIFLRSANYIPVLPDIRWYTDSYLPVNLSVYDIPYNTDDIKDATYVLNALENSPFYRYVERNNLSRQLNEAQNRFIREHNIRFVVVQKGMDWFNGRPFRVEQVIPSNMENYDLYVISPQ